MLIERGAFRCRAGWPLHEHHDLLIPSPMHAERHLQRVVLPKGPDKKRTSDKTLEGRESPNWSWSDSYGWGHPGPELRLQACVYHQEREYWDSPKLADKKRTFDQRDSQQESMRNISKTRCAATPLHFCDAACTATLDIVGIDEPFGIAPTVPHRAETVDEFLRLASASEVILNACNHK